MELLKAPVAEGLGWSAERTARINSGEDIPPAPIVGEVLSPRGKEALMGMGVSAYQTSGVATKLIGIADSIRGDALANQEKQRAEWRERQRRRRTPTT